MGIKDFDIKLKDNRTPREKYYKDTFEKTYIGGPQILKPGMKKNPKYKMGGGKISKYYKGGGYVITGRD